MRDADDELEQRQGTGDDAGDDGRAASFGGRRGGDAGRRRLAWRGRPRLVGGAVVLALLLGGGVWWWLSSRDVADRTVRADGAVDPPPAPAAPADSAASLPPLDASDARVRELLSGLSSRPELAEWLVTDRLVRRFVGAVVSVAAGTSPRDELEFLDPEGEFRVREGGEGGEARRGGAATAATIDPASYRRYDPVAATFASLDTEGTARLYRRLRPLFREAYRELGFSEGSFHGTLARAVENLLAVPVPEGPVEVVPADEGLGWAYRDPALEALSPAQKHLLRMGPENVRRVQAKLRELAGALDLPLLRPPER